jgi:hypothetical protein
MTLTKYGALCTEVYDPAFLTSLRGRGAEGIELGTLNSPTSEPAQEHNRRF